MGWFLGLDIAIYPIHMKEVLYTPSDMPIFRKKLFNTKGFSYHSIDAFEKGNITLKEFRIHFSEEFQEDSFDRYKLLFWIPFEEVPLFIGLEDEILQKVLIPIRLECGK